MMSASSGYPGRNQRRRGWLLGSWGGQETRPRLARTSAVSDARRRSRARSAKNEWPDGARAPACREPSRHPIGDTMSPGRIDRHASHRRPPRKQRATVPQQLRIPDPSEPHRCKCSCSSRRRTWARRELPWVANDARNNGIRCRRPPWRAAGGRTAPCIETGKPPSWRSSGVRSEILTWREASTPREARHDVTTPASRMCRRWRHTTQPTLLL